MTSLHKFATLAVAVLALHANDASAAAVVCSDGAGPGLRELTISPAKVGGLCYTALGNFNANDYNSIFGSGFGAVQIDKDEADPDDPVNPNEAWLTGFVSNTTSGNWGVSDDAWNLYQRIFLGFHFGNNNGAGNAANPDSFIVELARSDNSGSWALGGAGAVLNGLSHIDLIGAGSCDANPRACDGGGGGGGGGNVPEPGSLALVGLALMAAFGVRRLRRR